MNLVKKTVKILLCILLIIVCTLSVIQKAFIVPIHNVFDEMYYSGVTRNTMFGDLIEWDSYITGCSYGKVGVYQYSRWMDNTDQYMAEDFGRFERPYKTDELNKGESITINVYLNKKEMDFVCGLKEIRSSKNSSDMQLHWRYSYFVDENILYINGPTLYFSKGEERLSTTDEEQIASFLQENGYDKTAEEYEHYFLYDKIIHDWTLGNLFCSKYATWWIGSVKFVDGPPPEEAA